MRTTDTSLTGGVRFPCACARRPFALMGIRSDKKVLLIKSRHHDRQS